MEEVVRSSGAGHELGDGVDSVETRVSLKWKDLLSLMENLLSSSNGQQTEAQRASDGRKFFQNLGEVLKSNGQSIEEQDILKRIGSDVVLLTRLLLLDTWSVIRKDSARAIRNQGSLWPSSWRSELFISLQSILTDDESVMLESRCWQEIDGALMGCTSLIATLSNNETSSKTNSTWLLPVALSLLSHLSTPVREAAKDVLVTESKSGDTSLMESVMLDVFYGILCDGLEWSENQFYETMSMDSQVEDRPTPLHSLNITLSTEGRTLQLDSLLALLLELLPRFSIQSGPCRWQHTLGAILHACLLHEASTVRQKAGSLITQIVLALLSSSSYTMKDNTAVEDAMTLNRVLQFFVEDVILKLVRSGDMSLWPSHESVLLVSEELIRGMLTDVFTSHSRSVGLQAVFASLATALQEHFSVFLVHPRFEVRRAVVQLLPTLARAEIVFSPYIELPLYTPSFMKSPKVTWESPKQSSLSAASVISLTVSTSYDMSYPFAAEVLSEIAWLAVLVREHRHVVEIFLTTCSIPVERWSCEVVGRLLETELRLQFHRDLEVLHTTSSEIITQMFWTVTEQLLKYATDLLQQLAFALRNGSGSEVRRLDVISNDFVELIVSFRDLTAAVNTLDSPGCQINTENSESLKSLSTLCTNLSMAIDDLLPVWISLTAAVQELGPVLNQRGVSTVRDNCGSTSSAVLNTIAPELVSNHWILRVGSNSSSYEKVVLHGIRLLPTLLDPATNPAIHLSELVSAGSDSNISPSTSSAFISPVGSPVRNLNSVSSPVSGFSVTGMTSPKLRNNTSLSSPMNSPSFSCVSPNRLGPDSHVVVSSRVGSFQAMNRWNCETLSPMLGSFSSFNATRVEDVTFLLCASGLFAEWILATLSDPLWLDNRRFARKVLFEALPTTLSAIENALMRDKDLLSSTQLPVFVVLFHAMSVGLQSSCVTSSAVDSRVVLSLLRSLATIIRTLQFISLDLIEEQWPMVKDMISLPLLPSTNLLLDSEDTPLLSFAPDSFSDVFQSTLNILRDCLSEVSFTDPSTPDVETAAVSVCSVEEEDEFSDWDDDEDSLATEANHHSILQTESLRPDVETLQSLLAQWQQSFYSR